MIAIRQFTKAVAMQAMFAILLAGMLPAQRLAPKSDVDQITSLITGLSDHSKTAADVLDPTLNPSDRSNNLQRFRAPHYELSLVPLEGIKASSTDSASVPIRVHFDDGDGNQLDTNATARFVKRNGSWYFSDFDFMAWPTNLLVVLILGLLVAVAYATVVLVLGSRLAKQGTLGLGSIKIFIPLFWPALFRQSR